MVGFKDRFIWFKEWCCCSGKYPAKPAYQFNLPEETAWWTLQAGSQKSAVPFFSCAPITAAVTVQGSLRLLLPHKTGVQGLGRSSRIWAESGCCSSRGDNVTERHSRIYSVLRAVTVSPLSLVYWLQVVIEITPQTCSSEFDSLVVQTWLRL